MATWILVGIVFFLFVIFLYVFVKGSQDDNQAVSLNMKANEPVLKDNASSKARNKKERQ